MVMKNRAEYTKEGNTLNRRRGCSVDRSFSTPSDP